MLLTPATTSLILFPLPTKSELLSEDRGAKGDDGWGEHQAGGPCHGDLYDGDGDDNNDNEDGGDGNGSNGDEDVKNETPGDGPDKGPA